MTLAGPGREEIENGMTERAKEIYGVALGTGRPGAAGASSAVTEACRERTGTRNNGRVRADPDAIRG